MSRPTPVPERLRTAPLRTLRTKDLSDVYAQPTQELKRLVRRGVVVELANGYYCAVPDTAGSRWRPTVEAAGAAIATAIFGESVPILMGLSAARLHGAIPRAQATAIVAIPRQHRPINLAFTRARVDFVTRRVDGLDAERLRTELGGTLSTTPEQTLLDLARRPELGGTANEAEDAIKALWPRCEIQILEEIAETQKLRAALRRAQQWAAA